MKKSEKKIVKKILNFD